MQMGDGRGGDHDGASLHARGAPGQPCRQWSGEYTVALGKRVGPDRPHAMMSFGQVAERASAP